MPVGYAEIGALITRDPLSLAQIYAALAFYHANKQEIDADIAAEERAYDEGVRSSGLPVRS